MRFGVLGTGMVGQALGTRLAELGHDVTMGSRTAGNPVAVEWAERTGGRAGSFADAARDAEVVVNATPGSVSLDVLTAAGAERLAGKVLVDVSNPLAPDTGFPPLLLVANDDSLAERIQRAFPDARVVKTLNTVTAPLMVDPSLVEGEHTVFLSGDDAAAKAVAAGMLTEFGWPATWIRDLGGIESARAAEMLMALWLRLYVTTGTPLVTVCVRTG